MQPAIKAADRAHTCRSTSLPSFSHAVRVMLHRHVHLLVAYKIGACSKSLTELGEAVRSIAPHAALGHVTHTSAYIKIRVPYHDQCTA